MQRYGQVKVIASMVMVPKALIHQICLPSISIHHFDQSESKGLRFVPKGNPNSSDHQQCLAHEATLAHGQIPSMEVSLIHHFMHI